MLYVIVFTQKCWALHFQSCTSYKTFFWSSISIVSDCRQLTIIILAINI